MLTIYHVKNLKTVGTHCEAIPSSFNVLVNVQDTKEQKWLEALFFGTLAACPGIFVVLVLF